ncbi:SPOSA6832_01469 [Sporobolomyces salmonicolor]|uniref:SPOSA6832_01469-mRNA-1:cds n=1 Tax=Sporidiobolus salmonicolor TaxID=5005 RepID=A0A0D6EJU6_SPOSA|nr:SPOSA6832_01469 [Sporobolomyces salmonicolor]
MTGRREGGRTRYARPPPEAPLTTLLPPPFRASLRRSRLALPRLDILSAVFSIIGNRGKVHGSLARAGKVKSQTPKVEAQEKKKKVTGRAKKRLIYNSRFVNPGGKVYVLPSPRLRSVFTPDPRLDALQAAQQAARK